MSVSDSSSGAPEDPVIAASQRLHAAIDAIAARVAVLSRQVDTAQGDIAAARDTDEDRARLAEALDAAQARELDLLDAVDTASKALDAALAELEPLASEGKR